MAKDKDNPMQIGIRVDHRRWQIAANHMGDYNYGGCPKCGVAGNCVGDEPSGEDNIHHEWFECEDCRISYYYETTTGYRYGGIDDDARR